MTDTATRQANRLIISLPDVRGTIGYRLETAAPVSPEPTPRRDRSMARARVRTEEVRARFRNRTSSPISERNAICLVLREDGFEPRPRPSALVDGSFGVGTAESRAGKPLTHASAATSPSQNTTLLRLGKCVTTRSVSNSYSSARLVRVASPMLTHHIRRARQLSLHFYGPPLP